ncbi:MAG: WG repeat-containing protein [Bacteroidota bacterium]|nr:WG repeat-containing protein [Bacteroidota bacterium]
MKKQFLVLALFASLVVHQASAQTLITQVKPVGSKFWGYANLKGELVIPAQYEKCYRFSEDGYATIYDNKARQYFFINPKGERLTTEIASFKLNDGFGFDLEGFKNGLVGIKVGEKWGFLNTEGKLAIPAKYDYVSEFNGGYAVAKLGATYIVLNTKGVEALVQGAPVLEIKDFSENLAPFRSSDKKFGFIGTDGKIAIPAQFESVGYFRDGLAWAKTVSGSLGYINTKGEWAIQPQFDAGKNFDPSTGLARIKTTSGNWAYVNKAGELTYVNDTEAWGDFSDGLADGKKGDKKGFYDSKGKWVIQPQFDGVRDFKNGYAAAKLGDRWGIIDKTGKWVIQPTFDGIKDMEAVR